MVERQFTTKLKNVQTDWGGEFRNLASFFSSLGIIHRRSCPHTSEQNGFVERRNRHVVETGLTLLAQACVPQRFWHYDVDTAVYLINRMPSRTSTNNPSHHGYRCLDISTERLYIARHVHFNEAQFPFDIPKITSLPPSKTSPYYYSESPYVIPTTDHPSPSSPCSSISSPSSVLHLSPTSQTSSESSNGQPSPVSTASIPTPPPPPPITRQRPANLRQNPKQRVPYNPSTNHATVLPTTITEPTSFTVANNSSEWRQAMKEEYDAIMKNRTWSLVPRASNTNVVDGRWVYRLKRDKNGAITRYKARFVAKGFRQQPGFDFHETFSPVVKSTTIRAVLSLAVTNDWTLRQLDIHNAFFHGNHKEQVYMKQPLGFIDPQRPNHVCLLHKSLYGLKQAPRAWFERLSKALFDLGFKGSKTDPSLFIYSRGDTLLYILVYVDDIIVTGNNKGTIDNIICQLGSAFALKDLGPLNYFLGIEIVPHVSGILLSQKKYILELLQSAGLSNCNPVSSPMVTSSSLSLDDSTAFSNPVKYRQVVGSLQYVTLSRPDIAFAVNKVCQYMHAPTENHWSAVKRILRYLHGTVEHGMLIRRSSGSTLQAFTDVLWKGNPDTSLEAFSDADWAGDSDDRRLSDTVAELTWLQALLNELGIRSSSTPILRRDPISMEPFWMQHAADSAVVISGWHRMSYKYADHTTMSTKLEKYIRKMHSIVGNSITEGRYLVFGIGSSQLLNAAVYALSSKNSSTPSNVFASIPFYPSIDEGPFQMGTTRVIVAEGTEGSLNLGLNDLESFRICHQDADRIGHLDNVKMLWKDSEFNNGKTVARSLMDMQQHQDDNIINTVDLKVAAVMGSTEQKLGLLIQIQCVMKSVLFMISDILYEGTRHESLQDAICEHHEKNVLQDDVHPRYVGWLTCDYSMCVSTMDYHMHQNVKENA
ncbi:putative RNA-directed DNA polymerase [Tanacetum coccineum]